MIHSAYSVCQCFGRVGQFTELIVEYVAVAVLIAEDIASFSDTPPLIRVGMEYAYFYDFIGTTLTYCRCVAFA